MSKIDLMNTYVSNLAVLNVKLHNLHWNVVGMQFEHIHNFTEELYDEFFEKYDDVAEQIVMLGKTPLSTVKDYLANATIQEVAPKAFAAKEVVDIVKTDIETMKALAVEIRNLADDEGDFTTVAMFEDHCAGYAKNLWFLSAMLK